MATIVITGSEGVVGSAISTKLSQSHEIIPIDLPETDATDTKQLTQKLRLADTVIHLAGKYGSVTQGRENWLWGYEDPYNFGLFRSVLSAATSASAPQFIHASSIHVEDTLAFSREHPDQMLLAEPGVFSTNPRSGYGRGKRKEEAALRDASIDMPAGAVSLRFGAVNRNNAPLATHRIPEILEHEKKVWLGHDDLADLIDSIVTQPQPYKYSVINAVSDNPGRFHDTSNSVGWQPETSKLA